jgi:hypothetical protein
LRGGTDIFFAGGVDQIAAVQYEGDLLFRFHVLLQRIDDGGKTFGIGALLLISGRVSAVMRIGQIDKFGHYKTPGIKVLLLALEPRKKITKNKCLKNGVMGHNNYTCTEGSVYLYKL